MGRTASARVTVSAPLSSVRTRSATTPALSCSPLAFPPGPGCPGGPSPRRWRRAGERRQVMTRLVALRPARLDGCGLHGRSWCRRWAARAPADRMTDSTGASASPLVGWVRCRRRPISLSAGGQPARHGRRPNAGGRQVAGGGAKTWGCRRYRPDDHAGQHPAHVNPCAPVLPGAAARGAGGANPDHGPRRTADHGRRSPTMNRHMPPLQVISTMRSPIAQPLTHRCPDRPGPH
jgi:hypothetical protein